MLRIIALATICVFFLAIPFAGTLPEVGAVTSLVEGFGRSLRFVPLLAPAEIVEESMRQHYGEYVTPELLEEWLLCPPKAPGRTVSNPWPDRIEISTINQVSESIFEVNGEIVEVTNCGEAARKAVTLVVVKREDWRIKSVLLLPPKQVWGGDDLMKLSLEERIGQLVMVGLEGPSLDPETQRLVTDYHVGGLIFFARNIGTAQQTTNLINALKRVNGGQVPLFFSVDEEGGRVSRLPDQFPRLPVNAVIGEIGDGVLANQMGQILAQRVKGLGFNVNYSPVLDINSNPGNPVIGDRSYGADPDLVSRLGIEAMKGIQAQGVIPVIKHFPGHGNTAVDSHVGLPQVEADLDRLRTFELIPFREAIQAGADMVMTAHILIPKLDPRHPATLSGRIIMGLLRKELGFDGVVITDDLCMAAIKDNYDFGEAAVQAINAGVDIVMVCHDYENYITVLDALREAAYAGRIAATRIDEAVSRILQLKERYRLLDEDTPPGDIEAINKIATDLLAKF